MGRKDKFVKIFGKRYNLSDIEKYLKEKNFNVKCIYKKPFLQIITKSLSQEKNIKSFASEFLKLNSNYIFIKKKSFKSFKEY